MFTTGVDGSFDKIVEKTGRTYQKQYLIILARL